MVIKYVVVTNNFCNYIPCNRTSPLRLLYLQYMFLSPLIEIGGCALFLETILSIHGEKYFSRILQNSRQSAGHVPIVKKSGVDNTSHTNPALVTCRCTEQRFHGWEERCRQRLSNNITSTLSSFLTKDIGHVSLGHKCLDASLLTVLLRGSSGSLDSRTKHMFGIDIIDAEAGTYDGVQVAPVTGVDTWILRGPLGYTVMWKSLSLVEGKGDTHSVPHSTPFFQRDHVVAPGLRNSFILTHWNPWKLCKGCATSIQVIPKPEPWSFNLVRPKSDAEVLKNGSFKSVSVIEAVHTRMNAHAHSGNASYSEGPESEADSCNTNKNDLSITIEDINCVTAHLEDKVCYLNEYQRWRYNFSNETALSPKDMKGLKEKERDCSVSWKSFHLLSDREKKIVEWKYAPRINVAVWTRWPGATVGGPMSSTSCLPLI